MTSPLLRLPHARVDTAKVIDFHFDGRAMQGVAGDTLASALLANGCSVVGRSFKFHRPRGIVGAGTDEPNALVQLESGAFTEPNVRATLVPLYQGLVARGQNAWPNVRFDVAGVLTLIRKFLPASFYYKTFMWPSWHFWEGLVRRVAGLGKSPTTADPSCYVKQNLHVDIVVVGAGRSGIEAAINAGKDPAVQVLLLDGGEDLGGSQLSSPHEGDRVWLAEAEARLRSFPNIRVMLRTTVNAVYVNNVLAAVERTHNAANPLDTEGVRERLWRIFPSEVVLATGAMERPLVFPHNDRPGIMLASAAREYTHRYGITLGRRIVFYANNDSAWRTALELAGVGLGVDAIVDVRLKVDQQLVQAVERAGIRVHLGMAVVGTRGGHRIKQVSIAPVETASGLPRAKAITVRCDLLAMSGGWTPTVHLFSQAGGQLAYRTDLACHAPASHVVGMRVVGRANAEFREGLRQEPFWITPGVAASDQWVDLQYDVTAADIQLAVRENFVSVEHVKRYTTNGMSVDQGKTSNVNGLAILAQATRQPIDKVGTTRFRPPYHPATIGAFAGTAIGELYSPYQLLPAHSEHVAAGAVFEDYGAWKRPVYYPIGDESEEQAIARESLAVRRGVGLLDYSPLGKLVVSGPDATEFLNRVYLNNLASLGVGQARYALLLTEAGIVADDGVIVRLAEDSYLVHTTSGGATMVHQHLERWLQTEWPELRVLVTNTTTQWATLVLTGPLARQVLSKLDCDIDLSADGFRHMQFREGMLQGAPCRILRASFTGELSFEISVPARKGLALWQALMRAGVAEGIVPFGLESLMLLRTEKGYLHIGADTDGNTMPQDLGWDKVVAKKKADFIGKRSLTQEVGLDPARYQFTGLELVDPAQQVTVGAHVLSTDKSATAGYVTSAFHSPTLGRTVALGLVSAARSRVGAEVDLFDNGKLIRARLTTPGAYDPNGERLND